LPESDRRQSLKRNTISVLVARIITPLSSLILIICIARFLGAEELGKYSLILSLLLLFQVLPTFGLNYFIVREVSRNPEHLSEYLIHGAIFFTLSSILAIIILNYGVKFFSYPNDLKQGIFIVSFAIIPSVLSTLLESLLMGIEQMSYLSTVNLFEGIFRSFMGIFGVLVLGLGFYWLVWVLLLSRFIMFFSFVYILRDKLPPKFVFQFGIIRKLLKASRIFFGINVFAILNSRIDFIVLSVILGLTDLGYYSVAYRIIETTSLISGAIVTAFYPVLSRVYLQSGDNLRVLSHKLLSLIAILFIPISVGLFFYADFIIGMLFSSAYHEAVIILRIMSLFSLLAAFDQVCATINLTNNRQKQELAILAVSFCFYVAALLSLVPVYGLVGGALATVLAMLVQVIIKFSYIYKNIFTVEFLTIIRLPLIFLIGPVLCFYFVKPEALGGGLGIVVYLLLVCCFSEFNPKQLLMSR